MKGLLLPTLVLLGSVVAGSYTPLFAQSETTPTSNEPSMTGVPFHIDLNQLTGTAVLAWYAWHTASRTVPEQNKRHIEEMAVARGEFLQEIAATRKSFQDQIATLQQTTHADAVAVTQSLGELAKAIITLNAHVTK